MGVVLDPPDRVLWLVADDALVGPLPPAGKADYALTYYSATKAIADLGPSPAKAPAQIERTGAGVSL